jgi:hypothetical protein
VRSKSFGDAEQDLKEIARVEGYCVDEIVELVRVNEDTMDMMKVRPLLPTQLHYLCNGHTLSLIIFSCCVITGEPEAKSD